MANIEVEEEIVVKRLPAGTARLLARYLEANPRTQMKHITEYPSDLMGEQVKGDIAREENHDKDEFAIPEVSTDGISAKPVEKTKEEPKRKNQKVDKEAVKAHVEALVASAVPLSDYLRSVGLFGDKKLYANISNYLNANGIEVVKGKKGKKSKAA